MALLTAPQSAKSTAQLKEEPLERLMEQQKATQKVLQKETQKVLPMESTMESPTAQSSVPAMVSQTESC
jgi:hypothetical protein